MILLTDVRPRLDGYWAQEPLSFFMATPTSPRTSSTLFSTDMSLLVRFLLGLPRPLGLPG